jgi:hypothetical protein
MQHFIGHHSSLVIYIFIKGVQVLVLFSWNNPPSRDQVAALCLFEHFLFLSDSFGRFGCKSNGIIQVEHLSHFSAFHARICY